VNKNCEKDEDGDYVCEECGYTIPVDTALVVKEETVSRPDVQLNESTTLSLGWG
jgi:hypothetical protein